MGQEVGLCEGCEDGKLEGIEVGLFEGSKLGQLDGKIVGVCETIDEGYSVD